MKELLRDKQATKPAEGLQKNFGIEKGWESDPTKH